MTDAAYLKSTVGDALTKGMTAIAVQQPKDAVEFMGKFLLNYYAVKSAEQEAKAAAEAPPAPAEQQEDSEAVERRQAEEALAQQLSTAADVPGLFGRAMEVIKGATGASGVYLGRKSEAADAEVPTAQVQYVAADSQNTHMVGSSLVDPG